MSEGSVVSIFLRPARGEPTLAVEETRAVPGRGIEGDRFFIADGETAEPLEAGREITLIEEEAIEALKREYGVEIAPGETRRNVLTRGISLNHLVEREFEIGEVRLRGVRLCEPCEHLEDLTRPGVRKGLIHRGGLRAEILTEGNIRVGDSIRPAGGGSE